MTHRPPPPLSFSFEDIRTTSDKVAMTMSPTHTQSGTAALPPSSSRNKAPATNVRGRDRGPTRASRRGKGVQGRGSNRKTQHHQPATATATPTQWTAALTRHFLEAIVSEFEAKGQEAGGWGLSAWISVQNAIWDKTQEFVDELELVKKYKTLKSDWRAWVLIKEDKSVIGTGYNPVTALVEGPGYWWDKMIARNPNIAKFRDKSLDHVDLMERVYREVTATGSEAYAAGDSDSDYDGANGSKESDGMNSDGTRPATKNTFVPPLWKGKAPSDPNLLMLHGSASKKRKAPENSDLSASLAQLIENVKNNKSRVLQVRKGEWGASDAVEKLRNLPLFSNNQQLEFLIWCVSLFKRSDKDVNIFCSLATVQEMAAWIKMEHEIASDTLQAKQTRGLCSTGPEGLNYAIRKLKSLPVFSNPEENVNFLIWCMNLLGIRNKELIIFCNLDTPKQFMAWLKREYENHRRAWESADELTRGPPLPSFPDYE